MTNLPAMNQREYSIFIQFTGDTCCFPFSLGAIKKLLQTELNNTYVKSLEIGGNIALDYESGFFVHPNKQIEYVCDALAKDEKLNNGYHAIGFSQGGQFLYVYQIDEVNSTKKHI